MKKLIVIAIILMPVLMFAQKEDKIILPIDTASGLITFDGVIKVDSATKDDLYLRANEWFAKTYNSSKDVIQLNDKSSGKIIGKGSLKGAYSYMIASVPYFLLYTISITTKENRYRFEISNLSIKHMSGPQLGVEYYNNIYLNNKGSGLKMTKKLIPDVYNSINSLVSSLQKSMKLPFNGLKSKDDF